MKIRSYKGASLEQLYEAIRRELGPEAIVINTHAENEKRSLLHPFKSPTYELIAVVDDQSGDQHLADLFQNSSLQEISSLQARAMKTMQQSLDELRSEIRGLAGGISLGGDPEGLPDFAADWDPRFIGALRKLHTGIFNENMRPVLHEGLKSLLPTAGNFHLQNSRRPHVIVFAGPTGSGKTTTLAKLAARACLEQKLKIACITTDTFRVAAVDQIKEYATLLGIELAVAFSAAEAANAVARFNDRDVIFVDTPGRNHYDQVGLSGIRGVIQGMGPVTVLLHVPAALNRRNTAELLQNFNLLNPNYIVLTKADETRHHAVLTTLAQAGIPIAFVTDGQRVPQDIHPAHAELLTDLLLPPKSPACCEQPTMASV